VSSVLHEAGPSHKPWRQSGRSGRGAVERFWDDVAVFSPRPSTITMPLSAVELRAWPPRKGWLRRHSEKELTPAFCAADEWLYATSV